MRKLITSSLIALASLSSLTSQASDTKMVHLSGLDSAAIVDGEETSLDIFIHYPGELSQQCGIRFLAAGGFGGISRELRENILVYTEGQRVLPDQSSGTLVFDLTDIIGEYHAYGIIVNVKSKDGRAISKLPGSSQTLVVASEPCAIAD
ncbi:hypothetical protein [Pseudobacteriovorax antillogorgiicola]|uniref:Uncharacterized protein n=1 Tax=Pseudobacteriovorax antillogorgiicola TaxID=1513793 RepID=A0A1Y6BFE6_9BACT|nr:hypothetical protein [Pseudobacteriovorax antillogorgiicola]TCS56223.1 hypothetical protein EDD56_10445 [Pseudobacteriovorax antillogorgiicola]SMF08353.1 hypothetical protein SAMN06296036_104289 [Pseudobacteriovorax antillogorgiicola]